MGINHFNNAGIRMNSICLAMILTVLCVIPVSVNGQTLYFIHNGPVGSIESPQVSFETKIFQYDVTTRILQEIWTLGEGREARKIGVYPFDGKILILSSLEQPNYLYVFSIDDINNPIIIELDTNIVITNYQYYSNSSKEDIVEIRIMDKRPILGDGFTNLLYKASDGNILADKNFQNYNGQIRLCGGGAIGSPDWDVVGISGLESGKIKIKGTQLPFDINPIDTAIIQQGSSKGWVLTANEPDYCALLSVPDNNNLKSTELLILDKITGKWKSAIVPGIRDRIQANR